MLRKLFLDLIKRDYSHNWIKERISDSGSRDKIETAVAVLMVEAARMDSTFGANERQAIETILAQRFSLSRKDVVDLVERAEATVADTTQYFPFTHHINQEMTEAEKSEVIEMLWRVAYADGVLDPHEDALIRQIAGLIHVTDRERAFARQRALAAPRAE